MAQTVVVAVDSASLAMNCSVASLSKATDGSVTPSGRSSSTTPGSDEVISCFTAADDEAQVRTLFVSGLPSDFKDRELYLMFRAYAGYEKCLLMHTRKVGKPPAGLVVDPDSTQTLRLEFARSNTKMLNPKPQQQQQQQQQHLQQQPSQQLVVQHGTSFIHPAAVQQIIGCDLVNGGYYAADAWASPGPMAGAPPPAMAAASPIPAAALHHLNAAGTAAFYGIDSVLHHRQTSIGAAADGTVTSSMLVQHHHLQHPGGAGLPPGTAVACTAALAANAAGATGQPSHQLHQQHSLFAHSPSHFAAAAIGFQPTLVAALAQPTAAAVQHSAAGAPLVQQRVAVVGPASAMSLRLTAGGGDLSRSSLVGAASRSSSGSVSGGGGVVTSSVVVSPCSTLFVANLGHSCTETELIDLFQQCAGFRRIQMHIKGGKPVAFVEFQSAAEDKKRFHPYRKISNNDQEDIALATDAMNKLQGVVLPSSERGGIRIEYARSKMADTNKGCS